jgi:hypothetical protein
LESKLEKALFDYEYLTFFREAEVNTEKPQSGQLRSCSIFEPEISRKMQARSVIARTTLFFTPVMFK